MVGSSHGPGRRIVPGGRTNALFPVQAVGDRLVGRGSFRDHRLVVEARRDSDVLFPTDVGFSLLAALDGDPGVQVSGARVLDVGCGSGLYTVATLLAGAARVTALDVNPACVEVTLGNVVRNGLDISAVTAAPVGLAEIEVEQPWDLVMCNPPHRPSDPSYACGDGVEAALVGGRDGRALYDVLLRRLPDLLAPGGVLLLAHSSLTDIARTVAEVSVAGFEVRTIQVCELDIPMRRYADHRDRMLGRLYQLRAAQRAKFVGLRFEVHTLAVRRNGADPRRES